MHATRTSAGPSQVTLTTRVSEKEKLLLKISNRSTTPMQTPRLPRLTVQKTGEKTAQRFHSNAATSRWCLYKSPITSHSLLLQPILDGRQHNDATADVSQARTATAHLTLTSRWCSSRTAGLWRPRSHRGFGSLLPWKRQGRPTPPLSATLQSTPAPDSAGACSTIPPERRPDLRSSARWAGRSTRRISPWRLSSSTASLPCCTQPAFIAFRTRLPGSRRSLLFPQQGQRFFVLRRLQPLFAQSHCLYRIFQHVCRVDLLGRVKLHDLMFKTAACRQLASRPLLITQTLPLLTVYHLLLDLVLPPAVTVLAEIHRV